MTRGDRMLVLLIALAVVVTVPVSAIALSSHGSVATINSPSGLSEVRLDRGGRYVVEGRQGHVTLEVSRGQIRCVTADCPDRTCVRMGAAHAGRPIVCAPNAVTVTVGSGRGEALDAVSR